MRVIGTHRVELNPINMTSSLNISDSPSSSGECNGEKCFGDTVPCEDMGPKDDVFETQVVDYDDETQPFDFNEETQIMDLAGETQVMDDYDDPIEHMDTQLLVISDSENDGEGPRGTQLLDDAEGLNDIQMADKNDCQMVDKENIGSLARQDDGDNRSESLPSHDVRRPGSLRRGFTFVRTASLRAAGLAAREMASKNVEDRPCSGVLDSGSSKIDFAKDGANGISVGGRAELRNDTVKHDEIELGSGEKCQVARSLARRLFMEEEVVEEGSDNNLGRMDDFSPLPRFNNQLDGEGSDNDLGEKDGHLAGLSYVDSQEPGELSQANALEFVDKFLKVNLLESDVDALHKNTVSETVTPGAVVLGAKSIAQEACRRSSYVGKSIFEWDDKLEDEGGGEFFTKKKEVLFGTHQGARKSCSKPRGSRYHEAKGSQSLGRIPREKGLKNIHDTKMGFLHSDSKLLKDRKRKQFEEMYAEKRVDTERLGLDFGAEVALEAPIVESVDLLNVGIDTQMAAEAMEALSTGTALVANASSVGDHCLRNVTGRCRTKVGKAAPKQQSSGQQRACVPNAGAVTRSKRTKGSTIKSGEEPKYSLALRPREHILEKPMAELVKPKVKRSRFSLDISCGDRMKEPSDRQPETANGKKTESNLEGESHLNQSLPVKRRSLRKKLNTSVEVEKNTHHMAPNPNGAHHALDDSGNSPHCLEGVRARKRRTRSAMASENRDTRVETVIPTTLAATDGVNGSSDKVRHVQLSAERDNNIGKEHDAKTAYGSHDVSFGSIAKGSRSKRSARSALCHENEKGRLSSATMSPENAIKLSSDKQDASPPAIGALATETQGKLSGKVQESSLAADVTPYAFKTPEKTASPICMGDGYLTPSCRKNLSLKKELYRLSDSEGNCSSPFRVLRQRRDMNSVRVLFSQHLDEDIVRQQRKILSRLRVSEASSILEATHFVADIFVRTRNILEAIANAKIVVTHLWLESCGQANCLIDEKNYILRDSRKEKELCFSMPVSLDRASSHPLLKGKRVLITPSIKPSKDVISSLVKAVHGQAIERLCRSTSNNEKLLDDLLVLSCEDDFEVCMPLLERGIAIYSSELLLNGIITQRLEYERHRLFVGRVKRTRSTLWLKDGDQFHRVVKAK